MTQPDRVASWMLERFADDKNSDEQRLMMGFLARLGLQHAIPTKSESPDFFFSLRLGNECLSVGAEIVSFHVGNTPKVGRIAHVRRWRRFASRLASHLHNLGMDKIYGAIHPYEREDALENLLGHEQSAIVEISTALQKNGQTKGILKDFANLGCTLLADCIDHIYLRDDLPHKFWWLASLQAGSVAEPLSHLQRIVEKKSAMAQNWNWRDAHERWLIVVAEAQCVEDTMILDGAQISAATLDWQCGAFTRVFAWDGFLEQIFQVKPNFGLLFEVAEDGSGVLHRRVYPKHIQAYCPHFDDARS